MSQPKLNWFDKTIWAMAELAVGEIRPNVYAMKIMFAGVLWAYLVYAYGYCWRVLEIVSFDPPKALVILLHAPCYLPVHLTTHSATEIETANLRGSRRWFYTGVGLFIFPFGLLVFVLLSIWPET